MRAYLDTSVLVALFTNDLLSARADALLRKYAPIVVVSDFAGAELASAIARRVRTRDMTKEDAWIAFSNSDAWISRAAEQVETFADHVKSAEALLRRLDLTLRTPDALNLAIAERSEATLFTFDEKMAICAQSLLLPTVMA